MERTLQLGDRTCTPGVEGKVGISSHVQQHREKADELKVHGQGYYL